MTPQGDSHEAHLSTKQYPPQTDPRLSDQDEDQKRPGHYPPPPGPGPQTSGRLTFRSRDRIKDRAEYLACYEQGRKYHSRYFLLFFLDAPARDPIAQTRLGIAAGRKIGNAVRRNRIKRLVRETFRLHRHLFPPHGDIVVVAKRGIDTMSLDLAAVLHDLRNAVHRIGRKNARGASREFPGHEKRSDQPARR